MHGTSYKGSDRRIEIEPHPDNVKREGFWLSRSQKPINLNLRKKRTFSFAHSWFDLRSTLTLLKASPSVTLLPLIGPSFPDKDPCPLSPLPTFLDGSLPCLCSLIYNNFHFQTPITSPSRWKQQGLPKHWYHGFRNQKNMTLF
jgi:hypothetical protein